MNYQEKGTSIIYRNYQENKISHNSISKLRDFCKKKNLKLFISNNFKLALNLKLDGAYIPSFNGSLSHLNFSINKNFKVLGSAHNIYQIRTKEKQRVDEIFISSLFKKNSNYLGFYPTKILSKKTKKQIILLGGISNKNVSLIKMLDCKGFAGISYFTKKKAPIN